MIKKAPIVFQPYLKTVIWGGDKICEYKGINQPEPQIGESWEISVVPTHESVVIQGHYKGKNLQQLVDCFGEELLGRNVVNKYGKKFPLLVKLIDANDNLSVQVHPDDALAMKRHKSFGKTEMWYILQADKDAKIYAGFNTPMTPREYDKRVENNTLSETLAIHPSHPEDVFFLPPGVVHAIGAGNLLIEIQESSDITYRIYDYNRRDANGKGRQLHTREAKDAIDFNICNHYKFHSSASDKQETSQLVECDHFKTKRIKIAGEKDFVTDNSSFLILICVEGHVAILCEDGEAEITSGHSVLIPAAVTNLTLKGEATLLSARV